MTRFQTFLLFFSFVIFQNFVFGNEIPKDPELFQYIIEPLENSFFTKKDLKQKGFVFLQEGKGFKIQVIKHKNFPKYLVKFYFDDQNVNALEIYNQRKQGADLIRHYIRNNGYEAFLHVPKKWIYKLQSKNHLEKYILIVENVYPTSSFFYDFAWRQGNLQNPQVEALFTTIKALGLIDCVYLDNIPLTVDGRIAFIDTQDFFKWPIPLHILMVHIHRKYRFMAEEIFSK